MPNKRVYSISIFWFFPQTYLFIWPYLFSFFTLLNKQIFHSTCLFGPLVLLFNEIYLKYPPYSFIWPYSFNWHLRVVDTGYMLYQYIPFWKKKHAIQFVSPFEFQILLTLNIFSLYIHGKHIIEVKLSGLYQVNVYLYPFCIKKKIWNQIIIKQPITYSNFFWD